MGNKNLSSVIRRRIRTRTKGTARANWADHLNTFLTSFISMAMLLVAFAQWRATEKQAEIADALAQLEFAKSEAKFEFVPSKIVVKFGDGGNQTTVALPRDIKVLPVEGVHGMETIDAPVTVYLSDAGGNAYCDVEVRGMYLENDEGVLSLFEPPISDFRTLVSAFRKQGLSISFVRPDVLVRYYDLLGRLSTTQYEMVHGRTAGTSSSNSVVLYSGAWSNGEGFYFDQSGPETSCPELAPLIQKAVQSTGGKPGDM